MTGEDDDATSIHEDSFLAGLIPQAAEYLVEQHAGEFNSDASQARFLTWLSAHAEKPARSAGASLEFKILGPPEVHSVNGQHALVTPKLWRVLVSLLMSPGTTVPIETLVDRLWGEDPPAKAREDLRVYISRLSRALRQSSGASGDEVRITVQAHGYTLWVDPEAVDLHQFRLLRRQADAMAFSGDDDQAIALLRAGDALWRDQALAGLPGGWVSRMRASLEEERRAAIAKRIELELRLGRHGEMASEMRKLTGEYPLDEALIGHQMTALYRSGRQADAIRIYREARDRLVDQGIEPSPALARLQESILRHDPELAITPVFYPDRNISQ